MSFSSTQTQFSQDLLHHFHPRKFILHHHPEYVAISPTQESSYALHIDHHANATIVFLVLICCLISCLGLFVVKYAIGLSTSGAAAESEADPLDKLTNRGIEHKALKAITTVKYTTELKLPGLDTACVICLSEFGGGEDLRILPKCEHGFHSRCIDKWLSSHSSCPTCRQCLIDTDTKNVSCNLADSMEQSLHVQESRHIAERTW